MLAVIESHPVQYHAPVYRALQQDFGIPVSAIYGSDFSIVGYHDAEFGASFAWDTDLLSGYTSTFLNHTHTSPRGLAPQLRRLDPAAVLLVGYSPRFYQLAFLHAWRMRRPLILRAETTDHALVRTPLKVRVRDSVLRTLYRYCARLLYVGQRSRQHFARLGCPPDKLVFSPYCVDTTPFAVDEAARARLRAATRGALHIAPTDTVLLLSGKLVQRKRADLVLCAVRALPSELREQIRVLALGSGEQEAALVALAGEAPPVQFACIGFQNQSRLSAYYHASDLLVLPSESAETWGLVVNEALHHGLPCVVSDAVGCGPDLVQPGVTGEVFESGSPASLAAAIERSWALIGRPDVRHNCRRVVSGYSVDRAAAGIARAYTEVVHDAV